MSNNVSSISAFFPVLNEAGTLERLTEDLFGILRSQAALFEIIIVDDGSTDGTGALADALRERSPDTVRVIHRTRSSGYGSALRAGFEAARYDLIFYTDGDYQFDLTDLPRALRESAGYDILIGYRVDRRDSPRRIFFSRAYNRLVRILFGLKYRDVDCSFKIFTRAALEKLALNSAGYFIDTEILIQARKHGLDVKEIGVRHLPRTQGTSKVKWRHVALTLFEIGQFCLRRAGAAGRRRRSRS